MMNWRILFCIYVITLGHYLTLQKVLLCISISFCTCDKAYFVEKNIYLGISSSDFIKIIPLTFFLGADLASKRNPRSLILLCLVLQSFSRNPNFFLSVLFGVHMVDLFSIRTLAVFFPAVKASSFNLFEVIVLLKNEFCSMRSRNLFWSCWINIYLSTTLLFCSFSILDFNYSIFVEGLLCLFQGIISVLPSLRQFFIDITYLSFKLSRIFKGIICFFPEISKDRSNFSLLRLVVNNIILFFDTFSIKRLSFSSQTLPSLSLWPLYFQISLVLSCFSSFPLSYF